MSQEPQRPFHQLHTRIIDNLRLCLLACFPRNPLNMRFATLNTLSTADASAWSRFHERFNDATDSFYYDLGIWVARQTKLTLLMSTSMVILCSLGLMNVSTGTEGDR